MSPSDASLGDLAVLAQRVITDVGNLEGSKPGQRRLDLLPLVLATICHLPMTLPENSSSRQLMASSG